MSAPSTSAPGATAARSVAVVGAGAAGLVAATFASAAGAKVTLVESTRDGGRKILISGGGRCNVLPAAAAPERFVTDSPRHLLRAMLRSWPLHEQRAFFEGDLGIPLALEKESGKLFPRSNRAKDVRDGLVAYARAKGVDVQFDTTLTGFSRDEAGFTLDTSQGSIACSRLVLATGGLSVPNTGSDGTGLRLLRALGLDTIEPYPALTPLLAGRSGPRDLGASSPHESLSGVSLAVRLRAKTEAGTVESEGGFLFTHRGYSGPSVLDISHVTARGGHPVIRAQWTALTADDWKRELAVAADRIVPRRLAAPGADETTPNLGSDWIATILAQHMPARLASRLMQECGLPANRRTSSLQRAERLALVDALTAYPLPWTGNEGYKKAEVTGGGIALYEVDARTLESRRIPGLFLCGELLDAFGPIGGHNFSWAWATGRAAGMAAGMAK